MAEKKNLWGQSKLEMPIQTPTQILKEQASVLSDMTKGVLQGDVTVSQYSGKFRLQLDIIAPAIDNYRYSVISASHGLDMYPVTVYPAWRPTIGVDCADAQKFEDELGKILSSDKVSRAVSSLLAQSRAM
jgi:hypothetical protein